MRPHLPDKDDEPMEIVEINRDNLRGVFDLCKREGWESYCEDIELTWKALTAPGVVTMVAVDGDKTLGFAYLITDGEIQSHLALIAVDKSYRGKGIGTRLVREVFARSGAKWIDLMSTEGANDFYRAFAHRSLPGFRIYPQFTTEPPED
jgi:ribosomal protein S18 acetylase RimI-like enzyme